MKIMKYGKTRTFSLALSLVMAAALMFTGCGQKEDTGSAGQSTENPARVESPAPAGNTAQPEEPAQTGGSAVSPENESNSGTDIAGIGASESDGSEETIGETELEVCFGDDGLPFILYLYDNDTAAAIARHVGTASWRLPIYHYDDYDNWESMQYYDIPSRYEIPSNAETVTSAKGGEVYYSEPNRIVLFYHDAEISAEYTKVGYFDYTDGFVTAVENNPVLDGWDTKIVLIRSIY